MDRIAIGLCTIGLFCLAVAGPNENAKLYVDFSIESDAIDSVGGCAVDSTITAAIKIHDASKLYSYEFYLKYDTSSLVFVSGKSGENILDMNGGSGNFKATRSKKDSTQLLIACFLMGDDPSECVSGNGVLGLINFKLKKQDTTLLSITSRKFIDCDLTEDTTLQCFNGSIIPSKDIHITHYFRHPASAPKIALGKGSLTVDFGRRTEYVLTAVNTLGKKLYSNKGISETIRFDGRKQAPQARSSNLMVIRISYTGNELIVPLIR